MRSRMRLLWIALEFSAQTFSGNGTYARSQVRALAQLGHQVLVISGKPEGHTDAPCPEGACQLIEVELHAWGVLDRSSSWAQFAEGAASAPAAAAVAHFKPDVVVGVDWTSFPAYQALAAALPAPPLPYIFMNYRVYHRTASPKDQRFYMRMEAQAAGAAALVVALSRSDAAYMREHGICAGGRPVEVLLPALRVDMERLPLRNSPEACSSSGLTGQDGHALSGRPPHAGGAARRYLTCCVRLSPEKEPDMFAALVEQLAQAGGLSRLGIVPLLCGSGQGEYAERVKARVRAAAPDAVIVDSFLGPSQLADLFAATLLNIHPCTYDAYGMTVVEAASQGAPSLVNEGGHVGATDLLCGQRGEVLEADLAMPVPELARHVKKLLEDRQGLLPRVGAAAAQRARSWTEAANAARLIELVAGALVEPAP